MAKTLEERFWEKVSPEPNTGCWLWTAATTNGGYGVIGQGRRLLRATRLSWEMHNGRPIPPGYLACHRCDTPACVNPAHLFIGTVQHNSDDMVAKGRSAVGARHASTTHPERVPRGDAHYLRRHPERVMRGSQQARAKLTEEMAREIRRLRSTERTPLAQLARRFGVSQSTVSSVVYNQRWTHA